MIHIWRLHSGKKEDVNAALQSILERETGAPVTIERGPKGKPYLPACPRVRFNVSHTKGKALIAVAQDVEVGVDIERIRPMSDMEPIAEQYLLPGDAEVLAGTPEAQRPREFFRLWTRAEALWKAAGLGLYCAGAVPEGEWDIVEIEAGEEYAAALAVGRSGLPITISDVGADA